MKRKIASRDDLVSWVQEHIAAGDQPHAASQKAFNEAIGEKRALDVLRALGWRYAFYEVWQAYNRGFEPPLRPIDDEPTPIAAVPRDPLGPPNERIVDPDAVRASESQYSKLVNIGRHEWVPLGDLTKPMCKRVAAAYRGRAAANAAVAEVFDVLDNGLEDETTTVRQRFSEAELEALWRRRAA
jgi:hypothetical protein